MNPTTAATNILFDNIGHHSYFFEQIRDHIPVYGYDLPVYGSAQATLQNQRTAATYAAATGRERSTSPQAELTAEFMRRRRASAERAAFARPSPEPVPASVAEYYKDYMDATPDRYARYEPVMPPKTREMPKEEF